MKFEVMYGNAVEENLEENIGQHRNTVASE